MIAEALPGGEPLVSAAYEGAGGVQEVGGVEGEEPAGLVGPEGGGRGVDPSPPVMVLGTGRGREPDLEGTVKLPEVAFGVATPPVSLQELEAVHLLGRRIGQEEEVVEEEFALLAGALEDDKDDPAGYIPTPGLVAEFMDPGAPLLGRASRGAFQVGLGESVEGPVAAKPGHVAEVPGFEGLEEIGLGEAGIHPKPDLEVVLGQLLEDRQHEGLATVGGVGLAFAELASEEVPVGQASHQRVVAAQAVVPIVGGARLVSVDLDGERVHVHDGLAKPLTSAETEPPFRQSQKRSPQRSPVLLLGRRGQEARQRRLAREPVRGPSTFGPSDRSLAAPLRDGEPEEGVLTQERRVAVVRPPLGSKEQIRQQELSERVPDPLRVPAVPQHLAKDLPIPQVLRQLPKEQGSRIPAQALTSRLDPDAAVEIRLEKRTLKITHGVF